MSVPHLRVARPTNDLDRVVAFYRDGLGLEVIASFQDHDGFSGSMLGHSEAGYHLEFTLEEGVNAPPAPTSDNLLVWYLPDPDEYNTAVTRIQAEGFEPVPSHNPYWDANGTTFEDPDGYRVVLANRGWPG